jgi:hypothetical protein
MSVVSWLVSAGAAPLSCDPFVRRRLFWTMSPSASSDEYVVSAGGAIIVGAPFAPLAWHGPQVLAISG